MYQGSHARAKKHSRIRMNKLAILFMAVIMLIGAAVGTTVAFLVTNTDPVVNNFTYGTIGTRIDESFDGSTKSNVKVTNTGDTPAFIRATYVATWRDASGKIVNSVPTDYSYELTENPNKTWQKVGNYFYYPYAVYPENSGSSPYTTDGSLLTCTVTHPKNPEYFLNVEIVASAIQSEPVTAVPEAWGVTIANGTVTAYTPGN